VNRVREEPETLSNVSLRVVVAGEIHRIAAAIVVSSSFAIDAAKEQTAGPIMRKEEHAYSQRRY
jgi:hypothetical protein